jgi:ketosteroid isomerase-like protein
MEEARGDARLTSDEEVMRRMIEAVGSGDVHAFSEGLHPDVVWEHNVGGGSLEEGTYRGRESVAQLFERILEPWEYMRLELQEVERSDEGALLIKGEMHSKHSTTAAEITTPYEQRLEFENGLLLRARMNFGPLTASEGA